jgi:hypothetical protein
MNVPEALAALGVTDQTLSPAEKEHLDREGYLLLPNMLIPKQIAHMAQATDALIAIEGEEAGTVVIFNSHTWHGGTLNRTDKPRRVMHAYFCRRSWEQLIQKDYIRPATYARLSEAARFILDV